MKKITLFLLVICILLTSCTAPKEKGQELMSGAMESANIITLSDLPAVSLGDGVFEDYLSLHSNPLNSASYPADFAEQAGHIQPSTDGLSTFWREILLHYGFHTDFFTEQADNKATDLEEALRLLYSATGSTENPESAYNAAKDINKELRPLLASFLSTAAEAYTEFREAVTDVSEDELATLQSFTYCPPATDEITLKQMENAFQIHNKVDEEKLFSSAMKMLQASEQLCKKLQVGQSLTASDSLVTILTPIGEIVLGTTAADTYDSTKALLLIDPSGDDSYEGEVAYGSGLERPFSVAIDLGGNDIYSDQAFSDATQGVGVLGVGLLFDLGGNDTYYAAYKTQGFGLLGVGLLFDANGNDTYYANVSAQGAAHYGIGGLFDLAGNDRYHAYAYAQASAGSRAMAFLVDSSGNDDYIVESFVQTGYEGLDYSQYPGVNGNWSQGCAMGQRNISTAERGISGGIAGLIDLAGNDHYRGGIWVQGVGYWSGIGFLTDLAGDDVYDSKYYSQASVAHYGVGILIDQGGNDVHQLLQENVYAGQGASIGFTWDRGVAMFVNSGGNDRYAASITSCGVAMSAYDEKGPENQDLTYAFFLDTDGNDIYGYIDNYAYGYGRGGFFLDGGGNDIYENAHTNNNITLGADSIVTYGGVFLDHEQEPDAPQAYFSFWEQP